MRIVLALLTLVVIGCDQATVNNPIELGSVGDFAILAGLTISNTNQATVNGEVGVNSIQSDRLRGFNETDDPGGAFAVSDLVAGVLRTGVHKDNHLSGAVSDMERAYGAVSRRIPDYLDIGRTVSGITHVGNTTLAPGIYHWTNDLVMDGDLILSGGADDIWIFQADGSVVMEPGVDMILADGALPKNITWQIAGSLDVEPDSSFVGTALCHGDILFRNNLTESQRLLTRYSVFIENADSLDF